MRREKSKNLTKNMFLSLLVFLPFSVFATENIFKDRTNISSPKTCKQPLYDQENNPPKLALQTAQETAKIVEQSKKTIEKLLSAEKTMLAREAKANRKAVLAQENLNSLVEEGLGLAKNIEVSTSQLFDLETSIQKSLERKSRVESQLQSVLGQLDEARDLRDQMLKELMGAEERVKAAQIQWAQLQVSTRNELIHASYQQNVFTMAVIAYIMMQQVDQKLALISPKIEDTLQKEKKEPERQDLPREKEMTEEKKISSFYKPFQLVHNLFVWIVSGRISSFFSYMNSSILSILPY